MASPPPKAMALWNAKAAAEHPWKGGSGGGGGSSALAAHHLGGGQRHRRSGSSSFKVAAAVEDGELRTVTARNGAWCGCCPAPWRYARVAPLQHPPPSSPNVSRPPASPLAEVGSLEQWRESQLEEWGKKEAARCDSGDPGAPAWRAVGVFGGALASGLVVPVSSSLRSLCRLDVLSH